MSRSTTPDGVERDKNEGFLAPGGTIPPYGPDLTLSVERSASLALGTWYAFGQQVLDDLPGDSRGRA